MGRRPVLVAVGVLALAGAAGAQAPPAPPQPTISIRQNPKTIDFGNSVTISGKLAGVPGGNGDRTLQLEQSAHPYVIQRTVDTTTTAADGSYSFFVTPDRNARFHVLLSSDRSVSSRSKQVYVGAKVTSTFVYVRRGGRMSIQFTVPPDINLARRKIYFYLSKRPPKPLRLVRRRRLTPVGPGVTQSSARFPVRPGTNWSVVGCLKSLAGLGLGNARRDRRTGCGRRRISRRRAGFVSGTSAARAR